MTDWTAILSAALGILIPSAALAVAWGRLLARFDAQDLVLRTMVDKLDELSQENVRALEIRLAELGEKIHAIRGREQLLLARVDDLEKSARLGK